VASPAYPANEGIEHACRGHEPQSVAGIEADADNVVHDRAGYLSKKGVTCLGGRDSNHVNVVQSRVLLRPCCRAAPAPLDAGRALA